MANKKNRKSKLDNSSKHIYRNLSLIVAVVLFAISGLAWWAHSYTSGMVQRELAAQKIYFPEKGSSSLSPEEFPDLQKYAGNLVDTPEEARAYANGFIGRHLEKIAGGKVYSEVSAEAAKDPSNEKLKAQKQSLFQGETLRGILLSTGFAFGTVGEIVKIVSMVTFVGGVALFALAVKFL